MLGVTRHVGLLVEVSVASRITRLDKSDLEALSTSLQQRDSCADERFWGEVVKLDRRVG